MNVQRQQQLHKALDHIVATLVTHYQPEKIILFGSYARDDVHAWSDLDLVIIKDTPQPFFARLKEVALLCLADVGVDYLVYTPAELAQMVAEGNPFIVDEVLGKGITLYERRPIIQFLAECAVVDQYYISTRYPGGIPSSIPKGMPGIEEAEEALATAEEVLTYVSNAVQF